MMVTKQITGELSALIGRSLVNCCKEYTGWQVYNTKGSNCLLFKRKIYWVLSFKYLQKHNPHLFWILHSIISRYKLLKKPWICFINKLEYLKIITLKDVLTRFCTLAGPSNKDTTTKKLFGLWFLAKFPLRRWSSRSDVFIAYHYLLYLFTHIF